MRALSLALALAFFLVAPAAGATTASLAFADGFGSAAARAEGTLEGTDARNLRRLADQSGDRDGTVTQAEADRFVSSYKSALGQVVGQSLTGGNATLDGKPVAGSEIGALAIDGAAGAVEGGPPIAFSLTMTFLFTPEAEADRHVLSLAGHTAPGGALRLTVSVPAGWHVEAVVGLGAGIPTGKDVRSVGFEMPPTGAFSLTFASDTAASPGLGAVASGLVLAAVAVLARRRA